MKSNLDIYQWKDYSILRIIEKKPFPSPKVWNSNRGIISGLIQTDNFDKRFFFYDEFPEINDQLKDKYQNKFFIKRENKQIPKADGTLGKSGSFINLFKEKKIEIASCLIDLNFVLKKNGIGDKELIDSYIRNLDSSLEKIYSICSDETNIDCGYVPYSENNFSLSESENNGKKSWERINTNLEIYSKEEDINLMLHNYIEKEFNFKTEDIKKIGENINNKKWLAELFKYSLKEDIWYQINSNIASPKSEIEKQEINQINKSNSQQIEISNNIDSLVNDKKELDNIPEFEPSKAKFP